MSQDKFAAIKEIPIMPQVATKILQMQEDNLEISFKELENIVLLDPALTAKILKVANSALYARQREITNLQQAISLLGFKTIKSLVLLVCASNMYGKSGKKSPVKFDVSESKSSAVVMWKHLVLTAFVSRYLAARLDTEEIKENVFIAGLLHDIGRVVYIMNEPDKYEDFLKTLSNEPDVDVIALEEKIFGVHHGEVGKLVFQKWNFPDEFIDTISQHHSMHVDSPHRKMVEIVGLANLYARKLNQEPLSEQDNQLKDAFTKSLSVPGEIDEYINSSFMKDIEEDELYLMCSSLGN
jgi:putative nucleotidyltransferase with HDIG domain